MSGHFAGQSERGFTMLEVMVALAILTMTSAIMYGTLSVTLNSQREVNKMQERYHAGRVAITKMARDVSCAFLSRHVSITEFNRETLFLGEEEEVTFTYLGHFRWLETESPESDQGVISYFLRSENGVKELVRREKVIIDDSPDKGGTEDVLASGVKSLEFEYWDKEGEDWTDEWKAELRKEDVLSADATLEKTKRTLANLSGQETVEDTFVLPTRVRIKLILEDDEDREYPFNTEVELPLTQAFSW